MIRFLITFACQKVGLTDLHFHDLRHTFVTRKVSEGWDYKRIMAITGHKTFAVFQRYNNPSEEDLKAVVANSDAHGPSVGKLLANGNASPVVRCFFLPKYGIRRG